MSVRKFVIVENGRVEGYREIHESALSLEELASQPGTYEVPEETNLAATLHHAYDPDSGQVGALVDTPRQRFVTRGAFMDRFSMPTQLALEEIGEGQTPAGRLVRVFMRRLEAEATVDLDSETLATAFGQLKSVLIATGLPEWADEATADATIATILA